MANQSKTAATTRIIWVLLGAFLLAMIVSQIYLYFYDPFRTEVAMLYTTTKVNSFKGVFVRDESTIEYSNSGVIAYTYSDGTKIARNSIIAKSYNNRRDILLQSQIEEAQRQVETLEAAELLYDTDNSQIESLTSQVSLTHSNLMKSISKGNYSGISDYKNEYLSLQSKKDIVMGKSTNFNEKISQLNTKISTLSAQISQPPQNMKISNSGYFVSHVDGYENKLNTSNIDKLTKDQIEEIIENPRLEVSGNIIGKMIDSYKWQLVGVLNTEQTRSVFEGSTVSIRVGSSSRTVSAEVVKVNRLDDGTSIIIFECDQLSAEFLENRTARFRLLLDDYSGIRISRSAVRFNDKSEQGVFIQSGAEIKFVKIKPLLSEDDYMIVENTSQENGYISLYDLVVIEGKDLYEGKIVYD